MTLFKKQIKIFIFTFLTFILLYMDMLKDGYILNLSIRKLNLKIFLLYVNIHNGEENFFFQCKELYESFQSENFENITIDKYITFIAEKLLLKKYYRMKFFYGKICLCCKIYHQIKYGKAYIISVNDSNIERIFHILNRRVLPDCIYYKMYKTIDNYILLNRPMYLNIYINSRVYMHSTIQIGDSRYNFNLALVYNRSNRLAILTDGINFIKKYRVLLVQYNLI